MSSEARKLSSQASSIQPTAPIAGSIDVRNQNILAGYPLKLAPGGTLQLSNGGVDRSINSNVELTGTGNANLVSTSNNLFVNAAVTGSGGLSGAGGTNYLQAANTYTGQTVIEAGALRWRRQSVDWLLSLVTVLILLVGETYALISLATNDPAHADIVAGAMAAGVVALWETVDRDAAVVTCLRRAGAVILGKANLKEWCGMRSMQDPSPGDKIRGDSGWSPVGGQSLGAHAPNQNPHGSSNGSAVSVDLGLVPFSIGTDTGGSVTYPAATSHALDDLTRTRALNLSDTPWQHRPAQATALLLLHMAKQYRHWTELAEAARGSAPTSPPARTSTEDA